MQFPIGRLSDKRDRRTVLLIASLATIVAALTVIWAISQPGVILFVAAAVFGGFCYTLYPLSSSQVNDLADPDRLVPVAAGLLVAYGIGASIGPIMAAQLMGAVGPRGLFIFIIGINVLLIGFVIMRIIQRPRGEITKTQFMPLGSLGVSSRQLYTAALDSAERETPDDTQET